MADRKLPVWDIGLGALVAAVVFLAFFLHWSPLESMELKMYDLRAKLRADNQVGDRKSTRLNSSHIQKSRMPSSA